MLIYIVEDDPDWQNFYRNILVLRASPQSVGETPQTFTRQADGEEGLLAPTSSLTAATVTREDGLARVRALVSKESEELPQLHFFSDGVSAIQAIDDQIPDLIVLDMLLSGPSAPSLLAELQSYPDLATIPILLVSGVEIQADLSPYGVSKIFNKATMKPKDLLQWISKLKP